MNINLATKHYFFVANLYSDAVSAPKNTFFVAKLPAVPHAPLAPPVPAIKPVYGL
jgi:hypothetical protein